MNPATALEQISTDGDPFLIFLKWLVLVIIVILIGAAPVMSYIRKFRSDTAENAKDKAEVTLYEHLQEQLKQNSLDIKDFIAEKNRWFMEASELSARVKEQERRIAELVSVEDMNKQMRIRLEEKDTIISNRDSENRRLTNEIFALKERLHLLELRLTKDEVSFCAGCTRLSKSSQ